VDLFREPLGQLHDLSPVVPSVSFFADKVEAMVEEHKAFALPGTVGAARVAEVQEKAKQQSKQQEQRRSAAKSRAANGEEEDEEDEEEDMALETLVVNEAEAEAEEEAEEEAQQEEQKMSAFSRDDEQANPWRTDQLANVNAAAASAATSAAGAAGAGASNATTGDAAAAAAAAAGDNPFYPLSRFQVTHAQPMLAFPPCLLVSDNYFRPRWIGLGERRLKNIVFVLEVVPGAMQKGFQRRLAWVHQAIMRSDAGANEAGGKATVVDSNTAAAQAIQMLLAEPAKAARLALASARATALQTAAAASDSPNSSLSSSVTFAEAPEPLPLVVATGKTETLEEVEEALAKFEEDDALYESVASSSSESSSIQGKTPLRFLAVLSLAEGETLRRAMHTEAAQDVMVKAGVGLSLRTLDGGFSLDESAKFRSLRRGGGGAQAVETALMCLRFVNCDMYYTDEELEMLLVGLKDAPSPDRAAFFAACQRLRRRERRVWSDTPLARVFTAKSEWHLLHVQALIQQMSSALLQRKAAARDLFVRFADASPATTAASSSSSSSSSRNSNADTAATSMDEDGNGSGGSIAQPKALTLGLAGLQRLCVTLRLGFSPADVASVASAADTTGEGRLTVPEFAKLFSIPEEHALDDPRHGAAAAGGGGGGGDNDDEEDWTAPKTWDCAQCGYRNPAHEIMCEMCGYGWAGKREVPPDKWACDTCSFFNPKTQYYCDICNRARPDLSTIRF
jgi:hypothetical protein